MNRALATAPRKGDWIQTFTGRQFWPLDPRPEDIDIADIAHALSLTCRFGGHCRNFYSVAEHSVLLASYVTPANALWALLHDAAEAYLCDVPRPVKPFLPGFREMEAGIMAAIVQRFRLPEDQPSEIKIVDGRILMDEAAQNMAQPPIRWNDTGQALGIHIRCWTAREAEAQFLAAFARLSGTSTAPVED